jgi:hypothetical protein
MTDDIDDIEQRLRKAFADPTSPLFIPAYLRNLQIMDALFVKIIQSPGSSAEAVAQESRDAVIDCMKLADLAPPTLPRLSRSVKLRCRALRGTRTGRSR